MPGGFLPPVVAEIRADTSQYSASMAEMKAETASATESSSSSMTRFASVGGKALLGIGAGVIALGVIGVKFALDAEANQARLSTAIKNTGHDYSEYAGKIDKARESGRQLGFSGGDTTQALTKLVNVTHDTGKAVGLMGLADDIARGRKIELGAATDLLVKVESGHVGLLGKLGLATKDATGATISQKQAIRELTDLYSGQASAYADTFRGKLEILEAQGKYLATTVGQFLIPIITGLGTTLADGVNWLDQNRAAAYALAAVIGGPLVVSMGIWIAQQAIAAGSALADFFVGLTAAVAGLGTEFELTDLVLAQNTAELLIAAGATEAEAAALLQLDAAAAGFTLAMGAALIAIVAVGAAIVYFGSTDGVFERNEAAAASWGNTVVNAAKSTGHELKALEETHRSLSRQIQTNKASITDLEQNFAKYRLTIDEANDRAMTLANSTDLMQKKDAILVDELKKLREEHTKNLVAAEGTATSLGVKIPGAAAMSSAALKQVQSAVKGAGSTFATEQIQASLYADRTGGALASATKDAQQFASSISASFQKATDPFSHFGNQAVVTEQEMERFFVGGNLAAQTWSGSLEGIINRIQTELPAGTKNAVTGLVQEMAKAGPSSQPALDAFIAMVNEHGVAWVNDMALSSEQAQAQVEQAYNNMAINAAIKSAEIAAVGKAAFQDLKDGGTSHLEALMRSNDTNMGAMAYATALHVGEMQGSVNSFHGKDVDLKANDFATGVAHAAQSAMDAMHDKTVTLTIQAQVIGAGVPDVAGMMDYINSHPQGAHGLVAMGRGGIVRGPQMALIGERPGSPEMVVPYVNPTDMVGVFRQTNHQRDILDAAAQAYGLGSSDWGGSSGRGGSPEVHYHTHTGDINIMAADNPEQTARAVGRFLETGRVA